jgi:4-carboxymuconolactone decarboxylase
MADSAPRFPRLSPERLTEAQKPVYERLAKIGRGSLGGPFDIMLRSPGMADGMIASYEHFRFHGRLDPRLKEFAILIVAREWTAQFEWYAHKPQAEKAGLSDATIADLRLGKRPASLQADEAIVYDLVTSLLRDHAVSDAVFAKALGLLDEERLVDLIALVGEYMKVALILNVGRVGVPDGNELPLPPLGAKP